MEVLALLTDPGCAATCLDAAVAAAAGGGRVRALGVDVDPDRLHAASEEIEVQRLRGARHGAAPARAAALRAAFDAWAAGRGGAGVTFASAAGDIAGALADHTGDAALVVLCRPATVDGADALHALAFDIARPMLVVPAGWRARPIDRVLVSWSGSPGSRRALALANPWLRAAREVVVLRIGSAANEPLEADGVPARIVDRPRDPTLGIAAQIVREAAAIDAAMIVAGAYRHAAAVAWLLGGTTRDLIAATDRPLFLAHAG